MHGQQKSERSKRGEWYEKGSRGQYVECKDELTGFQGPSERMETVNDTATFCHPERSEGSISVKSTRFFAPLRMTEEGIRMIRSWLSS